MRGLPSTRWLAVALFGAALLIRLVYLHQARAHPLHDYVFALVDSLYYHRNALRIAQGELLRDKPFFLAPLYPHLLGALYALFGPSLDAVRGFQALLGAASCVLLQQLGTRLFDARVGLLAGLLLAVYPLQLFYTGLLLPTVLVLFLHLLLLWLLLRQVEAPSAGGAAGAGCVLGLAVLAKSNALLLLPLLGGVWLWLARERTRRLRARWCAVFAAASLAAIAPATLHNLHADGRFVLVTTSTGLNLWKGSGPFANGTHPFEHRDRELGDDAAEAADGEAEAGDALRRTLDHLRGHPGEAARLLGKKLILFFNSVELGNRDQFYFARQYAGLLRLPVGFAWLAPLGLAGALWTWRPRGRVLLVHATLAAQVLSFVAVFVLARYRIVAVACLLLFASALLVAALDAARSGRWRSLAAPAAVAALAALLVNWPLAEFPRERGYALVYEKIGDMQRGAGRSEAAIAAYQQALAADWQGLDPNTRRAGVLLEIARAQRKLGRREAALATARRLLAETEPDTLRARRARERAARLASALGGGPRAAAAKPPGIVLLVADDLGSFFLGAYGNEGMRTPNIDRLAAEGMRFDAAFTPTALCRPSRFALYTGLHPLVSGVQGFDPPGDPSLLHQVLATGGYRTGLVGKFGSRVPEGAPFDFEVSPPDLKRGYDVEAVAGAAARFLEQVGPAPFFLLVGFADPHEPYPTVVARPPQEIRVPAYLPDLPGVRRSLARYQTAVERLDRGVGLVLDALERAGRSDDTLVVFTSDNGPAFPFSKSTLYDAGVRMPLVVRWPGHVAAGRSSAALVSFADLRPTLLAAAGLEDPAAGRGVSLLPLLSGSGGTGREVVFLSHTDNRRLRFPMRALRTARFKYIRNFEPERDFEALLDEKEVWGAMLDGARRDPEVARRVAAQRRRPPAELYDLASDPAELHNRIDDPALAAEVARLEAALRREMRAAGDPLLDARRDPD